MHKKERDKREIVYLGPKIRDCQIILKPTDESLEIGTIHEVKDGKDITGCDLISLEPQKDGCGYYMEYVFRAPKGPSKVSTEAYKTGWDRVFKVN